MQHTKKIKLSKRQKRKQTKKRTITPLKGGVRSCESAYVTESGLSIPDNGSIKGFTLPSKRALLRSATLY